jgi:hypothetical protein
MSELTTIEANRLAYLERDIAEGMAHFMRVGLALAEINRSKLYRSTHSSFEAYLTERWGISRGHAYRLMGAADVVAELSPTGDTEMPTTERQARELGKVEPEKREEVWKEAQETHQTSQPTASQIREVVDGGKEAQQKPTPSDEVDDGVDPVDIYLARWKHMRADELPTEVATRVEWKALAMEWKRRYDHASKINRQWVERWEEAGQMGGKQLNVKRARSLASSIAGFTHPDKGGGSLEIYHLAVRIMETLKQ